jgi:hypothetical protein
VAQVEENLTNEYEIQIPILQNKNQKFYKPTTTKKQSLSGSDKICKPSTVTYGHES